MLFPTRRLLILLALPVPALVLFPGLATTLLALGYDVAIALAAAASVLLSAGPRQILVQRRLPEHLSLGA